MSARRRPVNCAGISGYRTACRTLEAAVHIAGGQDATLESVLKKESVHRVHFDEAQQADPGTLDSVPDL